MLATETCLPTAKCLDIERLSERATHFGFRHARYDEVCAGVQLAANATGEQIVSSGGLAYVDSITHMSNWVTGDPVDGIFVAAPLTDLGVTALLDGQFTVERPLKFWLSQRGKDCAGLYIGVIAGRTPDARRRIMMAASVMRLEFFSDVYCFARGVTDQGRRAMRSLGLQPFPDETASLFMQKPLFQEEGVAA